MSKLCKIKLNPVLILNPARNDEVTPLFIDEGLINELNGELEKLIQNDQELYNVVHKYTSGQNSNLS